MRYWLLLFFTFAILMTAAQAPYSAYTVFDAQGKPTPFEAVVKAALQKEVTFFGELHNNPIAHWLQGVLLEQLKERASQPVMLGAEMLETDVQLLIDEYSAGLIAQKNFEEEARLWKNYKTDYQPIVEYAIAHKLPVVATNVPRRYAALVHKKGLAALTELSAAAKRYLPPLPIPLDLSLSSYQAMIAMMGGHEVENVEYFPSAQALKDATMAHHIVQRLGKSDSARMLHLNGSFHSNHQQGIVWYVQQYRPATTWLTIATVTQPDVTNLAAEHIGTADFIICIPESMTNTH